MSFRINYLTQGGFHYEAVQKFSKPRDEINCYYCLGKTNLYQFDYHKFIKSVQERMFMTFMTRNRRRCSWKFSQDVEVPDYSAHECLYDARLTRKTFSTVVFMT